MEPCYTLRAHHGMCLAYFRGVGYSQAFVDNMTRLQQDIPRNPSVRVTAQEDAVCRCCPHLQDGVCTETEKVVKYDRMVLQLCGIPENTVLPLCAFMALVQERILKPGRRESVCGDCEWNALCRE